MLPGPMIPFTDEGTYKAPVRKGVYCLYDGSETIYIGMSDDSIFTRVRSHWRGTEGPCTKAATGYKYETTEYPYTREKELLDSFKATYGRLPRCNDRR